MYVAEEREKFEAASADVIHPFSSTFDGPRSKPITDAGLCCCGLFATKGRNVNKMLVGCPSEPRRTVVACASVDGLAARASAYGNWMDRKTNVSDDVV